MITDYAKLTTTTTPVRVADDGTIVVPLVGQVSVGGMEIEQAEQAVNAESITRGVFRNPCITMTMKQCRTCKVMVAGAVNKPGTHELPARIDFADGGDLGRRGTEQGGGHGSGNPPHRFAASDAQRPAAHLSRGDGAQSARYAGFLRTTGRTTPEVIKVDLAAATSGLIRVPDLRDGDVVHVAKRNLLPIYVIGLVTKPGSFPYPPNQEIRVLDALALAGGCSNPVGRGDTADSPFAGAKEPVRIAVSLQGAKNGQDNIPWRPATPFRLSERPRRRSWTRSRRSSASASEAT